MGPFFYLLACKGRGIEPDEERGKMFVSHQGKLDETADYLVVEYPRPRPVDFSEYAPEELFEGKGGVLAPYFSAFVFPKDGRENLYFVLGQAPIGGGTTLRRVSEGANSNLGPGPEPKLEALLEVLRELGTTPMGGAV